MNESYINYFAAQSCTMAASAATGKPPMDRDMTDTPAKKPGRPVSRQKGEDILQAARQLLFSEGPQALTMERVAQEARVSKVTLYARYANRNELIQAVIAGDTNSIHRALGAEAASLAELQAGLRSLAEAMIDYIRSRHYRQLTLIMGSIPQENQDLETVYRNGPERAHRVLTEYLAAASRAGLIACPEPEQQAEMLMGMILGLDLLRSVYRVPLPTLGPRAIQAHARRIVTTFLAMYAAPAKV
ncbi:hypothetical protein D9M68_109800 [compost metagenome]